MTEINNLVKKISRDIKNAFGPDRHGFRRKLNRIKRDTKRSKSEEQLVQQTHRLWHQVQQSKATRSDRKRRRPKIAFPPSLPITAHKDEIVQAISTHRVVIIAGETGSGKTTQIPKMCLAAGRGIDGEIGCTQPRRIAAVSVANRISEELEEPIGQAVGFKIRFQDKTSSQSYIKVMTDGILLAETQSDPWLSAYDTIIVDEAHERSLNIDFLLGILKTLVEKRKDLKLIITSATIDTEKFSKAFDNAPIIEVSGRMYPVEVRWASDGVNGDAGATAQEDEKTPVEKAAFAIDDVQRESRSGDILVFMPTEQDIRETIELLEGRQYPGVSILPLFARLTATDQAKVFSRKAGRKIIVATNIAETSLTIPGIKYVVDTGLARVSRYSPRSRTTALPVVPVSKSSADQRMGRCGRVENGVCIRLFSEADYNERPRFTRPEILRANLADVILRMISLNLPNISEFPFIDRPEEKSIQDGFDLLMELGALDTVPEDGLQTDKSYRLTDNGRQMAAMPVDPRLSRMLIEARKEGCLAEIAVIVSALSIQDPRERPADKAAAADQAHAVFGEPASDFTTLLNVWYAFHELTPGPGHAGRIKKFCKSNFLSFRRMREWRDIYGQVMGILEERRWISKEAPAQPRHWERIPQRTSTGAIHPRYMHIHKSILSGFLSNIAQKKEGNMYRAAKDREVMVFPGSHLFNQGKTWIMAAEMVETSRLFARTAAFIDPEWVEPLAKGRCRYVYLHPHWEKNRGEVVATEQVSLYGLIIKTGNKVAYGPKAPDLAAEIFIRSALVEGDVKTPFPFMRHNLELMQDVMRVEDKIRRKDILISDEELVLFYKHRLEDVYDLRTLSARIKKAGGDKWLRMRKSDLVRYLPGSSEIAKYPDHITLGQQRFSCQYHFDPESDKDGVTVAIPADTASHLSPKLVDDLDWLVPGLYEEKIVSLLKGLPKAFRRQLSPVSDTAAIIASEMPQKTQGLLPALSVFVYKRFGIKIPKGAWPGELPDHLKMRIAVTDKSGKEIAAARDASVLQQPSFPKRDAGEFDRLKKKYEKNDVQQWNFGDLSDDIRLKGETQKEWVAYPALVSTDPGNQRVGVRLFLEAGSARAVHREGVRILFCRYLAKDVKHLRKNLTLSKRMAPLAAYVGGAVAFQERICEAVLEAMFAKDIRRQADFFSYAETAQSCLQQVGMDLLNAATTVLQEVHATRTVLHDLEEKNKTNLHVQTLMKEIRAHLSNLIPETFVTLYDAAQLSQLPRHIKAMAIRAQKGAYDFQRDRKAVQTVMPHIEKLNSFLKALTPEDSAEKRQAVEEYFWMLEEYKISVFAQGIKTAFPVSAKRLEKMAEKIEGLL